jgi:hypothetical protein
MLHTKTNTNSQIRRTVLTACGAIAIALSVAGTGHAWAHSGKATYLRVNSAVALPGVVLLPGNYIFDVANPDGAQDLVRVSSSSGKVHFVGFTVPAARPRSLPKDQAITLDEAPAGTPQPIRAWFPLGLGTGHEFMYR